jgi:hypothetical protein
MVILRIEFRKTVQAVSDNESENAEQPSCRRYNWFLDLFYSLHLIFELKR